MSYDTYVHLWGPDDLRVAADALDGLGLAPLAQQVRNVANADDQLWEARSINVGNMASNVSGIWRKALTAISGSEMGLADLEGKASGECAKLLRSASGWIREHLAECKPLEPDNGWGTAEGAADYLAKIATACDRQPLGWLHFSR